MMNIQTISSREMLRNYKGVVARVQETGEPTLITSQKKPQVLLVSVNDLPVLEEAKGRRSTQATLKLVGLIPTGSGLPKDLSEKHSDYAWD